MGVVAPRRGASSVAQGWANVVSPTLGKRIPHPQNPPSVARRNQRRTRKE